MLALAALATGGWWYTTAGQVKPDKGKAENAKIAVSKTAEAFVKAFDAGDAKAVAALWTAEGELVGADGEQMRGRKAIEESYIAFFKENPKAKAEVSITSIKLQGRHTATEEGKLTVTRPGDKEPSVSFYTALHVLDEDGWRMASVRESAPAAADMVSLAAIEWLIGDWAAKAGDAEARISFAWDENKAFIVGKYSLRKKGKVLSSGTQMIGKGTEGELRSWQFDNTGAVGEWAWWRDGEKWQINSSETLPGGGELVGVHLLTPLGKNQFLWQTVERALGEVELPDLPPLKVERVKAGK
jgi:uncharacterized protein (TIGR02246 family)